MTNTQRAVMQQALDALEYAHATNRYESARQDLAIAALRKALAEQAVEPVATFDEVFDAIDWDVWRMQPIRELVRMIHSKTSPQLEVPLGKSVGEPVAEVKVKMTGGNAGIATVINEMYDPLREPLKPGDKLYASPPAEVPLLTELREMLERRAHDSDSCGLLAKAALQLLDSQTRSIPLLTDEEIKSIHTQLCNTVGSYYLSVARAIEQLVRQKAGIK